MSASDTVPSLDVLWHGHGAEQVGRVVNPGTCAFGYDNTWLQHGANLSPLRMPFSTTVHRLRDEAFDFLPGFLADCLPDAWGRTVMLRDFEQIGASADPIRMLAWVGARGLGALRFQPAWESAGHSTGWDTVQPIMLAREAQAVLRKAPPEAFSHLRNAGTAGGHFPKATVALVPDGTMLCGGDVASALLEPQNVGARLGIIKLDVEDDFTRPSTDGRLEKAYMEMARAAGLSVAKCEVIEQQDDRRTRYHLFVERFDVLSNGAKKLHLLSLAGALESFQNLGYVQLLDVTRQLTQEHAQVVEAVRRMAFNVRAANSDDHGKNHAFTFDRENNRWSLAPAYDLTLNFSLVRSFNGLSTVSFGKDPRKDRMEEIATGFGLSPVEFAQIDAQVASTIDRWTEFAERCNVPAVDIERAAKAQAQVAAMLNARGRSRSPRRRRRW